MEWQGRFCDTDFIGIDGEGGGRFETADAVSTRIATTWRGGGGTPYVVFTGGEHFWLQPMDGAARQENTKAAVAYCLAHPHWRLSLQTHKVIGIP